MSYNRISKQDIIRHAKLLIGKTLRDLHPAAESSYGGKGGFGQLVEKLHFEYDPNSLSDADFSEVNMELKCSPIKKLKNGKWVAKERIVLSIIDYFQIVNETFEGSGFWQKNRDLLLILYRHKVNADPLDLFVDIVDNWVFPKEDEAIIRHDWQVIQEKVKAGKAHEISEGDTFYLGACTKGSTAKSSMRKQPFSSILARQRAYSLKQGYVNHVINSVAEDKEVYGRIISAPDIKNGEVSVYKAVEERFLPFVGRRTHRIQEELGTQLNERAKGYYASLARSILTGQDDRKVKELEASNTKMKIIRLKPNGLPKEAMSFPSFKYEEIIKESWEDSMLLEMLEQKFFFVVFQCDDMQCLEDPRLLDAFFWNMPYTDIQISRAVWNDTIETIRNGDIVEYVNERGRRQTNFVHSSSERIVHVRPHASNSKDTYPLPVPDKQTGLRDYTKHSFWINASYIKEIIASH